MLSVRYCTAALLALATAVVSGQGPAPAAAQPTPGEATYSIFVGGREVGREQVNVARAASGWIITSTGRTASPVDFAINRFEVKYTADWQPIELRIDARQRDRSFGLATSFGVTTAINEVTQNGVTNAKTDQVSARTVVLPNNFYAAYEALAARLSPLEPGSELPAYIAPQAEIKVSVKAITPGQFETPAGTLNTRRYSIVFNNPGGPLDAELTVDERGRFARLDIPAATLVISRQDLASVATRARSTRNPTDTDVTVPAAGFSLAGTITTPAEAAGKMRYPAVVLVAGSGPIERDGTMAGIPLFAQLAGALAEQGFTVVRYDKRGVGQSGGRTERATLHDYAEDVIAVVKWVGKRKDVDSRRIAVVGHSEGAAVAMLAAQREKKIAALVLLSATGTAGDALILEQQRIALGELKLPEEEQMAKIELQKKILAAAVDQKGWEGVPAEVRDLVDTPWYRSLLMFDPAKVMPKIKQRILIVHGARDRQVPPHHADRLGELANAREKSLPTEVVHLAGVNHLLVPARTGNVSEYGSLEAEAISPEVARIIGDWLSGRRQMQKSTTLLRQ
jgi:pimeloyl-ACP methyl ester carboxylesterase